MAEFQTVIKEARRLCRSRDLCNGCPLLLADEVCAFDSMGDPHIDLDLERIETIVMQWVVKNPEPQYPTWEEWQKEEFPHYGCQLLPCHFEECRAIPCAGGAVCTKKPIPAEIAKRFGIKPKGEKHG